MESETSYQSLKESKWNSTSQIVEPKYPTTYSNNNSIFEDILTRISCLNETDQSTNNSKDWQSIDLTMHSTKKEMTRNWTVAPKILGNIKQEVYSPDLTDSKCRVYDLKSNKNWSKNDLRPIGTKSASMLSVKNYNNRYENNFDSFSMSSNNNLCEILNKNVWDHEAHEKDLFKTNSYSGEYFYIYAHKTVHIEMYQNSIGIGLYAFFNPKDSLITHNVAKLESSNFLNNNEKIMYNKPVQTMHELSNRGKYSVAPLTLHNQNNSNNIKQNQSFSNIKRRIHTQSFTYNDSENTPLSRYSHTKQNSKYHKSISRQYSNDSNDSFNRSSPIQYNNNYQENFHESRFSGQRSNKNRYKVVNNHSNKGKHVRLGGKTVYNNDAYTNGAFRDSFNDTGSFQGNSHFLRR